VGGRERDNIHSEIKARIRGNPSNTRGRATAKKSPTPAAWGRNDIQLREKNQSQRERGGVKMRNNKKGGIKPKPKKKSRKAGNNYSR